MSATLLRVPPASAPDWGKAELDDIGGREFDRRYVLNDDQKLGEGGYASVFKGVHRVRARERDMKFLSVACVRVSVND